MKANSAASKSSDAAQDSRSLPKGSPERKAAVAAARRAQAAAARAKKAKLDALDCYSPPDAVAGAGESERRRLFAEAAWWVAVHGVGVDPPDELRRMLQKLKKKNETLFMKQVLMQSLPAPPREAPLPTPPQPPTKQELVGDCREKLAEWWAERQAALTGRDGEANPSPS
jgi:hypothetical protein